MLQVENILHHLLTTLSRTFRRVAVGFGAVFVGAVVVVEGVAIALTGGKFPPTGFTHVVAVIIGFSLALNVALVIAIEEGLRGFIELMRDVARVTEEAAKKVVGEVEKEGGQLLHAAEHEAQNLAHGAATAVRDAARVPGQIIGGIEGGVQGIERRVTGQEPSERQ